MITERGTDVKKRAALLISLDFRLDWVYYSGREYFSFTT
jgi:hypothetical protein